MSSGMLMNARDSATGTFDFFMQIILEKCDSCKHTFN